MSTESSTGGGTGDDAEDTSTDVETVFDNVDDVDALLFLVGDGGGVIPGWEKGRGEKGGLGDESERVIHIYVSYNWSKSISKSTK